MRISTLLWIGGRMSVKRYCRLKLWYGAGDATKPMHSGCCIIAHVCNDIGAWGKGFVLPLAQRYPQVKVQYKEWYQRKTDPPFALGQVQFVSVDADVWVANMIGQHGIYRQGSTPPIRYDALRECLSRVREFAREHKADVQMPRIGCGLAGGDWNVVSEIIEYELVWHDLFSVMVYDLPDTNIITTGKPK